MAISNYTELQAAIQTWAHKGGLTAVIPDLITLAESELNRRLRLKSMNEVADITTPTNSRELAFPASMVELKAISVANANGSQTDMIRVSRPELPEYISGTTGLPEVYALTDVIEFNRISDAEYPAKLYYIKGFALSGAEPTNWLLTNHPDLYLYACMAETSAYLGNETKVNLWSAKRDQAIDQINKKESRGTSLLRTDLPITTPLNSVGVWQ